jgi:hypothetical protein
MTNPRGFPGPSLSLNYPMSLGVYDDYVQAQRVVDHLSDNGFPVENVAIVAHERNSVDPGNCSLTRVKVAAAGAASGFWIGLFVGIAFALFSADGQVGFLITTPLLGALFGLIWSQLGFTAATRGGTRDFTSVTQVIATKYEVLVEHKFAEQARELITTIKRL